MNQQITIEQQRLIQLDILKYIDDFCKNNGINYSLAFGTLLGAVRHHGYIPWDDDIDIMMTRENYEKFRSIYDSRIYPLADLKSDKSHPVSMGKIFDSKTFFYSYGKIKRKYGLFVDVFPLDTIPEQVEERNRWLKEIKKYTIYNQLKNNPFSYILKSYKLNRRIASCVIKLCYNSTYIHRELESLYSKYNNQQSEYVGVPAVMVMKNSFSTKLFPKRLFDEYITLDFEGYKFQSIKGYDEFLTIFYGDYMTLPPIEKRVGKHGIIAYFK